MVPRQGEPAMRTTVRVSARLVSILTIVATVFATILWSTTPAGAASPNKGFVLLAGDGGVFTFGVPFGGAAAGDPSHCVGDSCRSIAMTPSGAGYWILDDNTGAVYAFGTAGFYGDPATVFAHAAADLIPKPLQIIPTPSGKGYWIYGTLSGLGTVEPFGDAGFFGDTFARYPWGTGHPHFNGHPVAMAVTADGHGYWELWSDGGVFSYGDATFHGSTGAIRLAQPIIGMTATADGGGYWLYAGDGGVFAFGDAVFAGSTGAMHLNAPIVGMTRNPAGPGYWLVASDGGVFGFGGAPWMGSLPQFGLDLHSPIVAIASRGGAIA